MRTIFVQAFIILVAPLIFSCSDTIQKNNEPKKSPSNQRLAKNYLTDCKKLLNDARRMDSVLLNQNEIDKVSANDAIKAFSDFTYYCQSDTLSPIFLIKTAQVALVINNIPQAKLALENCIENYPSFKNKPAALFLLAQLYDENTYLNNEEEAKRIYEQIINEYPKNEWALSAKGALGFLGKTDEQILQELKNKRKK